MHQLVTRVDKVSGDFSSEHFLSQKMTIYLYVFSLFVEDRIRCNVKSGLIITNKLSALGVSKLELLEKLL